MTEATQTPTNEGQQKDTKKIDMVSLFKKYWLIPVIFAGIMLPSFIIRGCISKRSLKAEGTLSVESGESKKTYPENYFKGGNASSKNRVTDGNSYDSKSAAGKTYASEIQVYVKEKKKLKTVKSEQEKASKKLGLPSGTKIPALVEGTLFSFNTEAPVSAVVLKDILQDGKVVIPKNSKFLGQASILKSLNRINVSFRVLVLPNHEEIRVNAMALSEDGSSGIIGKVDKHYDKRVFKAIGETLLAGASLFAGGISQNPYSFQDEMKKNVSESLTNEARQDLRAEKIDTSITVSSFTPIQVLLLDGI